jgi:very-short-patch-repair endonuclease
MDAINRCEAHAAANHGVIERKFALACGLSNYAIRRLVHRGRWIRSNPQAYLAAGAPVTWSTKLAATRAWLGDDCVFSHRTAGALLGLDGVPEGFVEVVAHAGRPSDLAIVHRLSPKDCPRTLYIDGFRITNAERTVFDLFSVLPSRRVGLALDDALRRGLTTIDRLWDLYATIGQRGRNGSRSFRRALLHRDASDGKLGSQMEAMLRAILRRVSPPKASPQFPVSVCGRNFYLDFAYPDVKLGVEAHSIKWHLGHEKAKEDLERDRLLTRDGWTLLYYPFDDLRFRPAHVAAEVLDVRNALAARLF